MPNSILDVAIKVDNLIPITSVLNLIGASPESISGVQQLYKCPFHSDSNPSFRVNTEMNKWNCFGSCGEGGGPYKLAKRWLAYQNEHPVAIGVKQVLRWLSQIDASLASIPVVTHRDVIVDPNKRAMFLKSQQAQALSSKPDFCTPTTPEEKRLYITGIMRGFDQDQLVKYIAFGVSLGNKPETESEDLIEELLGW